MVSMPHQLEWRWLRYRSHEFSSAPDRPPLTPGSLTCWTPPQSSTNAAAEGLVTSISFHLTSNIPRVNSDTILSFDSRRRGLAIWQTDPRLQGGTDGPGRIHFPK